MLHVDDLSPKCIDPRLLWNPHPEYNSTIETPHAFTLDTQPDLRIFPPSTSPPPRLPLALHTATVTTLLSLQPVVRSYLLSQKPQLSMLVRHLRVEETTTFAHKTCLPVTRGGGPKLSKASPSNHCSILFPPPSGNTSTKSSQR